MWDDQTIMMLLEGTRDVMKNLSLFQKICVSNFQKMYLQKKVH